MARALQAAKDKVYECKPQFEELGQCQGEGMGECVCTRIDPDFKECMGDPCCEYFILTTVPTVHAYVRQMESLY